MTYLHTFGRLSGPLYHSRVLDRQALHQVAQELELVLSMRMADLQGLRNKLDGPMDDGTLVRALAHCLMLILAPMITLASRGGFSAMELTHAHRMAKDLSGLGFGLINRAELKGVLSDVDRLLCPMVGPSGLSRTIDAQMSVESDESLRQAVSEILSRLCFALASLAEIGSLSALAQALLQAAPVLG